MFENDYDLMSLGDLRLFIATYKHLPDVPSAKEVTENGQNLGEMNTILLKKVEELTLYVLQQEERIKNLESQLDNSH